MSVARGRNGEHRRSVDAYIGAAYVVVSHSNQLEELILR